MEYYRIHIAFVLVSMLIVGVITGAAFIYSTSNVETTVETEVMTDITENTETIEPIEEIESTDCTEPATEETEPVETSTEPSTELSSKPADSVENEVAVNDKYNYNLELLACVIYQEAGGDNICDMCRYRVADVVLNRVNDPRFPDTIYGVLTQQDQYGRFYYTGVVWPERASYSGEAHAVARAYAVAEDVLNGNHSELYGNGYIWQARFIQGTDNVYCCGHYYGR